MGSVKINLKGNFYDVERFCQICDKYDFSIDYVYGRYIINAKSIMGIIGTGFYKDARLDFSPETEEDANNFLSEVKEWLVN